MVQDNKELFTKAEKMKFIRKSILKITLEEVSIKLGFSNKSSVYRIESENDEKFKDKNFYAFCGAYNIPTVIFEDKSITLTDEIQQLVQKHKEKIKQFSKDEFLEKHLGKWYWYGYSNSPKISGKDIFYSYCKIFFDPKEGYLIEIKEVSIENNLKIDFSSKGVLTRCGLQISARLLTTDYEEELNMTWKYNEYIVLNGIIFGVKTGYTMRGNSSATKCLFLRETVSDSRAKELLGDREFIEIDDRYTNNIN
jgi:hypothetical protein